MCGIVGYVGVAEATEFLIQGLHRLEYRGYDSAGVATITDTAPSCRDHAKRRPANRSQSSRPNWRSSTIRRTPSVGIGTHALGHAWSSRRIRNAHPTHRTEAKSIAVVHNGDHRELAFP